jgi:CspA family cold shock protein
MAEGEVKRWLDMRGYGFIGSDEYEDDVFVHNSALVGRSWLRKGERVSFDVEETDKGLRAVNVEVLE